MENQQNNYQQSKRKIKNNLLYSIYYQNSYFRWYARIPALASILTVVAFIIIGIVDACTTYKEGGRFGTTYYGIMRLDNWFFCWIIWVIIGLVAALIIYVFTKIGFSQKILTILYLRKLCGENEEDTHPDSSDNGDYIDAEEEEAGYYRKDTASSSDEEYPDDM